MTEIRSPATDSREEAIRPRRVLMAFISIVALVVLADQITKTLVSSTVPVNAGVELVPGILDIVHARNPGAAFGMFSDSASDWRRIFFIGISIAALAIILWLVATSTRIEWYLLAGYSLFFGGTLGNLVDRIRFGEVIDFIDLHWGRLHWPAFNVADSALCAGTALFVLTFVLQGRGDRNTDVPSGGDNRAH